MKKMWFAAGALLVVACSAGAQAFSLPSDPREREHWLSETLDRYEMGAELGVGAAAPCQRADAERWRRDILGACTDSACREAAYLGRIAALHSIQPGVGQIRNWEAPPGPALIAVLAPEEMDSDVAPDFTTPPDFEAAGQLIMASNDPYHMGLALRAADGHAHVLVSDMHLGSQPVHGTLQALIRVQPDARYLVRGGGERVSDGVNDFNSFQCRFVYRQPGLPPSGR